MGGRAGLGSAGGRKPQESSRKSPARQILFEYDPAKSVSNKGKHGIDFEDAKALWKDDRRIEIPLSYPDEPRTMVVAFVDGKHYSAIVTLRREAIRIISVRRSRPEEVKVYEQND